MGGNADQAASLRKQLRVLKISLAAAIAVCAILAGYLGYAHVLLEDAPVSSVFIDPASPNSKLVEKVIQPLRYSGYEDLIQPDVSLDMDFKEGLWVLRNIRQFDEQGNLILDRGRYGICGDLAAYTYRQILPHFPPEKYRIQFAKVTESSFFQEDTGSFHYILRIVDLEAGRADEDEYRKVYLLDPALRRYGPPEYFDSYKLLALVPPKDFLNQLDRAYYSRVDMGPPILINRNVIASLFVVREGGKFDRDNYAVVLAATRRYHFARKDLFVIRKRDGKLTMEEKDNRIIQLIQRRRYEQLKKSLLRLHAGFERAQMHK